MNSVKAGTAAQVLAMMGFGEADMGNLTKMVADAALSLKAMPGSEDDHAMTITDRWHKGQTHAVPSSEMIKVGPGQSASGGGAEHMVKEYSNPAPQKGLVLEAERLEAELGPMRGYAKSIADKHNALCTYFDESFGAVGKSLNMLQEQNQRLTIVAAGLLKALEKGEDEKGDDDEEKEEKFEINASKAAETYAKARALLKKSRSIRAQMKANSDAGHISALKAQAKLYKNAAKAYLSKAMQYASAGKSRAVVTRKALEDFFAANPALKAEYDPNVSAKALAKAAKKAHAEWKATLKKADDEGNQADKENKENGNQDDSAKAQPVADAEIKSQLENALKGIGMLSGNVKDLMDAVAGRPVTPPVTPATPAVSKAGAVDRLTKLDQTIEQYASEGRIDNATENKARDLMQKLDAVQKGVMHEGTFNAMIAGSAQVVQEIFRVAA